MPYRLGTRVLALDVPWSHDGVLYSAAWLRRSKKEVRERLGIVWEPDPPTYDPRFFTHVGEDGKPVARSLRALKADWIHKTYERADSLLSPTDNLMSLLMEQLNSFEEVKEAYAAHPVSKWRDKVRKERDAKLRKIKAFRSAAKLRDYIISNDYTSWPPGPNRKHTRGLFNR